MQRVATLAVIRTGVYPPSLTLRNNSRLVNANAAEGLAVLLPVATVGACF